MADKAQSLLDKFVDSIGDLLNDITALEVNTMIVAQITGAKFNAWEAYQEIYSINDPSYFKEAHIPENLHERYYNLFDKLEREYFYILSGSTSELKNLRDERITRYTNRIDWAKKNNRRIVKSDPEYVKLGAPILPNPTEIEKWSEIQKILENNQFLRSLRKIIELKAALDSSDPRKDSIDIIYAQTVMQLDGDVINRYHQKLFESEDVKSLILSTHTEGVESGEKQWRELLEFMVNLVKSATPKRFTWPK